MEGSNGYIDVIKLGNIDGSYIMIKRKKVLTMSYFYFCPNHPEEGACREQPFGENDSDNCCPECGKKFVMPYFYDICPWCKDELIERDQLLEGGYSDKFCPKCGRKLGTAMAGTQKIDDTTYKIILERASLTMHDRRVRFLEILKKMGNLSLHETLEKYKTKDSVIFEGDVREVYINMHLIDGFADQIRYRVVPEFPLVRFDPFLMICPTCGDDLIYKEKERGYFCEKCNKWILLPL